MKVYSVWSYNEALEPKLVQKFTTTLVESVAEERAIWDYAQRQRGKYFAVVRERFPQTDPPIRVILSVHTVRAEEARSESRARTLRTAVSSNSEPRGSMRSCWTE